MAEYIDREKAIEQIRLIYCTDCNNYNGVLCRACQFDDAMAEIEDYPAADVAEIVRCKDCSNSEICPDTLLWCNKRECLTYEEGFCNYGERKGDE